MNKKQPIISTIAWCTLGGIIGLVVVLGNDWFSGTPLPTRFGVPLRSYNGTSSPESVLRDAVDAIRAEDYEFLFAWVFPQPQAVDDAEAKQAIIQAAAELRAGRGPNAWKVKPTLEFFEELLEHRSSVKKEWDSGRRELTITWYGSPFFVKLLPDPYSGYYVSELYIGDPPPE